MNGHAPNRRLDIELYHVGELEETKAREVEEHLRRCSECKEILDGLRGKRQDFLKQYPYGLFRRKSAAPIQPTYRSIVSALTRPVLVPVYVAAMALMVVIPTYRTRTADPAPEISYKGKSGLSFFVRRQGQVTPGNPSDIFRAGDEIQLLFDSNAGRYLAVLSIDTRSTVSFYHPDPASRFCSVRIKPGIGQTFPSGIVLDDSPGHELVLALFSDHVLETDDVRARVLRELSQAGSLSVLHRNLTARGMPGIHSSQTLLLVKEER